MMSLTPHPLFYIDAIKTMLKHNDALHVDRFSGFLCCQRMPNVPGARIHIIDFCFVWTQPMPPYYHFVMPVPMVFILLESHSLSANVEMCSFGFYYSLKDIVATCPSLMSPCSILLETWVPLGMEMVNRMSEDEGEDLKEETLHMDDLSMDKKYPLTESEIMEEDSS